MKPMRIGINAYEANVHNRVGSNVYAFHLLHQIVHHAEQHQDEVVIYLPTPPLDDLPKPSPTVSYVILQSARLWSIVSLPFALLREKLKCFQEKRPYFDVFLSLGHYAPIYTGSKSVVCIMDVAYERYPELFLKGDLMKLRALTRASLLRAEGIITISESSHNDILRIFRPRAPIEICYPSLSSTELDSASSMPTKSVSRPVPYEYVLHVGTLQPRKNIIRLVEAFETLHETHPELHLVCIGKYGWMSENIQARIGRSRKKEFIHVLGFVDDEEKRALLSHACCVAVVGLYEGFGIPALEAIQGGSVPVVSETASLPEVVGPTGITVDPFSTHSIADGLERAIRMNVKEKKHHLHELREFTREFSWEKSGKKAYNYLVDIASVGKRGK